MWVFLTDAMLSVVEDPKRRDQLLVRARLPGDLQRVFPGIKVYETPGRDYRWRCFIGRERFAKRLADEARSISYGNFKNAVGEKARHDAYLGVWTVMHRAQEDALAIHRPMRGKGKRKPPGQGAFEGWDGPVHRKPLSVPF